MIELKIIRLPEALERIGICETSYRTAMSNGLVPKLIPLGSRAVGIGQHELDQVIRAKIAGLTDSEIKTLVSKIHKEREDEADRIRRTLSE